jgi:VWFA-related protein
MRKTKLLLLAVSIFFVAILAVAIALPQASPVPTFRARTRLVQVHVVVRDKNGPALGLNQDDFTLLDNGKPQKISVFAVKGAQSSNQTLVPLPAGTVSNRVNRNGQEAATSTVLLIDRLNTAVENQHYANEKIVKFLETRRSQDRIGIYAFGNGLHVVQDLTDDPDRLSRAVNSLKPQNAKTRTLDVPGPFEKREVEMSGDGHALDEYKLFTAEERVLSIKQAFEAIAHHLAQVPGRKSLIWVTGSFPLRIETAHETKDFSQDMKEAAQALNDANVALYAVDARGLVVGNFANPRKPWGLTMPGLDTMNTLAGLTGGRAYYADNGLDSLIAEAVEDSELIYTLGFYPSQESQDGDWHKLRVSVDRRGVNVRYREAYFAAKATADTDRHSTTLEQMLKDTLDVAEIGLRADTTPDETKPGFYNVRATVDLHDLHLDHQDAQWVGGVEISLYMEGAKSAYKITRKIAIPDSQLAAALESGIVLSASVGLAEPTGELRVVVQDSATGAGGSVRVPLPGK